MSIQTPTLHKKDPRSFFEKHERELLLCFCGLALVLFLVVCYVFITPLNPQTLILGV